MPKTDIKVKLVGTDGNVFAVIGNVAKALRRGDRSDLATEFQDKAFGADSYNDVFRIAGEYVTIH